LLCLAHLGCGHHLHRFGNPGCIAHRPDATSDVVGAMHTAYSSPRFLETLDGRLQFVTYGIAERLFVSDFLKQVRLACSQKIRQLGLILLDTLYWHSIDITVLDGPDHRYLNLNRKRIVLRLLKDFDDAFATVNLGTRPRIKL